MTDRSLTTSDPAQFTGRVPGTLTRAPLPSLTGMRWVAALGVFLYHATGPYMFPAGVFHQAVPFALRNVGSLALSFFFILTGFVMTWSVRPADTARRFWFRRFVKLYPNHLFTFLIMLALLDLVPSLWPNRIGATGVLPSLFMVQSWSPDPYINIGVNAVSWSLAVDAFFLLCFPLWMKLLNRIRVERLWFWVLGTIAAIVAVPFIALLLPYRPMLPPALIGAPTSEWQWWLVYDCPLTRSLECVLGSLAARLVIAGRWPRFRVVTTLIPLVAVYVGGIFLPINFYGIVVISALPMLFVTVAIARNDMRGTRSFLGHPVMIWLGTTAYAFYLLHRIVLEVLIPGLLKHVHWSTPAAVAMIAGVLGLTLVLARLLYVGVERPLVRKFSPPDPTGRDAYALGPDGARAVARPATPQPVSALAGEPPGQPPRD